MKRYFPVIASLAVGAAFIIAAPVIEKPLLGADAPAKVDPKAKSPAKTIVPQDQKAQNPAASKAQATKIKAKTGSKKDVRKEDDPIGTKK